MEKHRIAIVVGSLRKDSINRKVAKAMCALAGDQLDCHIVEIGNLPLFNQDLEASPPAEWVSFREAIAASDGVLFVTPEYNRTIPGVLKNAIDVGSRPYGGSVWERKPAAIVSASPGGIGGFGANHNLRQACVFLDMPVMQQPEAYLGHVSEKSFNDDGTLVDGPLKELVAKLAGAFAKWVHLIHCSRELLARDSAHNA
jgi:chromate reductase